MGFTLTLPLPPSTNGLFKNTLVSRAPTRAYRDWKKRAGVIVEAVQPQPLTGRYTLAIAVPRAMRGDVSNRIKAIEDLLVKLKLTDDDRLCDAVSADRSPDIPPGYCRVEARSAASLDQRGDGQLPPVISSPPAGAQAA